MLSPFDQRCCERVGTSFIRVRRTPADLAQRRNVKAVANHTLWAVVKERYGSSYAPTQADRSGFEGQSAPGIADILNRRAD